MSGQVRLAGAASQLIRGHSCDRNEIDAVAVALSVGEIVTQMRAIDTDRLAVRQTAHVLPDHLQREKERERERESREREGVERGGRERQR
jgi:hypothetical protein